MVTFIFISDEISCFENKIISNQISSKMQKIVGFRNVEIHEYQTLNLKILKRIIDTHLTDFTEYSCAVIEFLKQEIR